MPDYYEALSLFGGWPSGETIIHTIKQKKFNVTINVDHVKTSITTGWSSIVSEILPPESCYMMFDYEESSGLKLYVCLQTFFLRGANYFAKVVNLNGDGYEVCFDNYLYILIYK